MFSDFYYDFQKKTIVPSELTHTNTHTYKYTLTHTHTLTHALKYTHTHTRIFTHKRTHTHTHTHTNGHAHTNAHTLTHRGHVLEKFLDHLKIYFLFCLRKRIEEG